MNKKLKFRILATVLACLMVFTCIDDYSVLAASGSNTIDDTAIVEEISEITEIENDSNDEVTAEVVVSVVASEEASASGDTDEDPDPVSEFKQLSFNGTSWVDANVGVTVATWDGDTKTITFKAHDKVTAVPSNMFTCEGATVNKTDVKYIAFEANCHILNIEDSAFEGCTELIGDPVSGILDFSNCQYTGSGLTKIQKNAFKGCTNITKINLGNTVTTLEDSAFYGCSGLTEITLVPSLQQFGISVFENCSGLKTVNDNILNLSDGMVIGNATATSARIFTGCSISKINFAEGIDTVPKVLFAGASFDPTATIEIPSQIVTIDASAFAESTIKNISFKEENGKGCQYIGDNAFELCTNLQTPLNFPSTLKSIGIAAFKDCKSDYFNKIDLSPLKNLKTVGKEAFMNCINLNDLTLSADIDVDNMGEGTFSGCTALVSVAIPNNGVCDKEFSGCTYLHDVTFGNTVTSIGTEAFKECYSIETLSFKKDTVSIGTSAFEKCRRLTSVSFENGTKLNSIGSSAFKNCVSLVKFNAEDKYTFIIPDSVTEIGDDAFSFSETLALPSPYSDDPGYKPEDNKKVGEGEGATDVTQKTSNISKLTLSSNLETVGKNAFYNTSMLTSVVIPSKVKSLGVGCFASDSTNALTSVTINTKVMNTDGKSNGAGIFKNCKITEVILPSDIVRIPDKIFCNAGFAAEMVITLPYTVEEIGVSAFGGDKPEESIILKEVNFTKDPSGKYRLKLIDDSAFANNSAMTTFNIPDSVTTIESSAFKHCSHLSGVIIPEKVMKLGGSIWAECTKLGEVHYNAIGLAAGENGETKQIECGQLLFENSGLTNAYLGEKVMVIPAGLFAGAKFVTADFTKETTVTIYIPASVEEFPEQALINIKNLGAVVFVSDTTITSIGKEAFKDCPNLSSISVDTGAKYVDDGKGNAGYVASKDAKPDCLPSSVTEIGDDAFNGCSSLVKLTLPEANEKAEIKGLDKLGTNAFKDCTSLESIDIPASVTVIGSSAFNGCSKLSVVNYKGNNVKAVNESTFENTDLIGMLDITAGIETIGNTAYKNNTKITAVDFPTTVTDIAASAFEGCTGISKWYAAPGSYAETWLKDNKYPVSSKNTITFKNILETDKNINDASYRDGEEVVFLAAERTGFSFEGWFLDEGLTKEIKSTKGCTGNLVVYAKWVATVYNVTYELDNGTNSPKNPATVAYGSDLKIYAPIKSGYQFDGWDEVVYTKDAEGKITDETTSSLGTGTDDDGATYWERKELTGDIVVRAKWSTLTYTLVYDKNAENAQLTDKYSDSDTTISYTGEEAVKIADADMYARFNTAGKQEYAIISWNTAADGSGKSYEPGEVINESLATEPNQTVTLYAQWADDYYFIKYNANGGTISENKLTKVAASMSHDKKLYDATNVSRPGYKFVGWTTKKNGKGAFYNPGQVVKGIAKKAKKTVKLYAKWEPITYTITYDLGADDAYWSNPAKVKTEFTAKKKLSLKKPKRAGYKFRGWYLTADFTGNKVKTTSKQYSNITVYAKWEPK